MDSLTLTVWEFVTVIIRSPVLLPPAIADLSVAEVDAVVSSFDTARIRSNMSPHLCLSPAFDQPSLCYQKPELLVKCSIIDLLPVN